MLRSMCDQAIASYFPLSHIGKCVLTSLGGLLSLLIRRASWAELAEKVARRPAWHVGGVYDTPQLPTLPVRLANDLAGPSSGHHEHGARGPAVQYAPRVECRRCRDMVRQHRVPGTPFPSPSTVTSRATNAPVLPPHAVPACARSVTFLGLKWWT